MKNIKIDSSILKTVSYDIEKQLLIVEFPKGSIYQYFSVQYEDVLGMVFADSSGSYFMKNIAKTYKYEKVSD